MIETIKKGFTVAAKNLKLVLIVYGVGIVFGLMSWPFMRRVTTAAPGVTPTLPGGFWLIIIVSIFVQIFVMGGVLGCVREVIKKGVANINEFVNFGKKYYVRLLLSGLLGLAIALVFGFIFAALIGGIAAGGVAIKIILGLLLALCIIFGIALVLMLVFWPYAIVSEELGVIAGLKKSIEVARKPAINLLKILGMLVIVSVIALVVNLVAAIPQALFSRVVILLNIYRIFVVGAVGAYLNIALVSVLMAYYFTLKGEGTGEAVDVTPGAPPTETPSS